MNRVHIHRPKSWTRRRILRCPVDERMTECVVTVFVWYDPIVECARCGESWSGGEMQERPFRRGWRKRQQAEVRAKWVKAPHGPFPTLAEMDPEMVADRESGAML